MTEAETSSKWSAMRGPLLSMHETLAWYSWCLTLSFCLCTCMPHTHAQSTTIRYVFEATVRNRKGGRTGWKETQRLQWKCNHLQSDRYNSPLEGSVMRRLKDSLHPALHMDLIDHSHSSRDSTEILRVNYDVTALDVFILKPSIHSIAWRIRKCDGETYCRSD